MPRPNGARNQHVGKTPLAGALVMDRCTMTIQTAVLIETLNEAGADVRWVSCNIFPPRNHAAAAVAVQTETGGTPQDRRHARLAWKVERSRILVVHGAGARVADGSGAHAHRGRRGDRDVAGAQRRLIEKAERVPDSTRE